MERFKKIEILILSSLWVGALSTYSIALFNNYVLFNSDYLGLIGLTVATIFTIIKPNKSLPSVLIILILGLFNLLSFVYFFNVVLTFGFSGFVTPGIQLISLVLLVVLLITKKVEVFGFFQNIFEQTEEERKQTERNIQNSFIEKFEKLSDNEIDYKLGEGLVPEAIEALKKIKEERKNALQQNV